MFVPMFIVLLYSLYITPKNVIYFISYWAYWITVLSLFASIMVVYSSKWNSFAVYTTEFAFSLKICIVMIFWTARTSEIIETWNERMDSFDKKLALFHLMFVHATPIIASFI